MNTKFSENFYQQNGMSLVVVIVVLLSLTVLALAATNSNKSQSLMVRNTQFRNETFNASFNEIEAQVTYINTISVEPSYISFMRDKGEGTQVTPPEMTKNISYTRELAQDHQGTTICFGEQRGAGKETKECMLFRIRAEHRLNDTAIESEQFQLYQYQGLTGTF